MVVERIQFFLIKFFRIYSMYAYNVCAWAHVLWHMCAWVHVPCVFVHGCMCRAVFVHGLMCRGVFVHGCMCHMYLWRSEASFVQLVLLPLYRFWELTLGHRACLPTAFLPC